MDTGRILPSRGTVRSSTTLLTWFPLDTVIWVAAILFATWARYDFTLTGMDTRAAGLFALGAAGLNLAAGLLTGTYLRRYVPSSFDESAALAGSALLTSAALMVWALAATPLLVPRSVPVVAGAFALLGMWAVRYLGRAYARTRATAGSATRVVVFGAGAAGSQLVRQMRFGGDSAFQPVAFLDDDPAKRRLRICGVPVRGTRDALAEIASRTGATALVIAFPSAESALVRDLSTRASAAGLRVLILPPLDQLMRRPIGAEDLQDVDVNDLLGRHPIHLDEKAIAGQITGRRVLVTGAGGSIGSELCRQIHRFGPAELIMLDRDESALHAVQLSIHGRALLDGGDTVLVDIRDRDALLTVFDERRPEVVFHAAALKHLPLLEQFPVEAWKTNVVGTANVLDAAEAAGVSTFVNISTDKAANPSSVLGYSKRIAERLTAHTSQRATGRYVSVRFGNVLGSRGSVLTAFERQIAEGGPVTVTHPEVTRFFMTISEACQLVLQASAIGRRGEALVLDMGEPVAIVDVARALISRSGREDVDVVFTGLRPGEKLHEELFGDDEPQDHRLEHPLVSHAPVPELSLGDLSAATYRWHSTDDLLTWLRNECAQGQRVVVPLSRANAVGSVR